MGAAVVGCAKQCFVHECDWDHYTQQMQLPPDLATNPSFSSIQSCQDVHGRPPASINDPDRPPRYLSLAEAIAMSLENGDVGTISVFERGDNPPTALDTISLFRARGQAFGALNRESIRVLALEPAVVGANIEESLSKFDTQWTTSFIYTHTDEPTGGSTLQSFNNGDLAEFRTGLLKPLPTGGVGGITFNTSYRTFSTPPANVNLLNPQYRPSLQFQFEQPLLQGFGVEINQLRAQHPGSLISPFQQFQQVEGILITRVRFDQQRAELEQATNNMLLNVENAYWNLYSAYWALYAQEQGLRQAYEAWKINKLRFDAGKATAAEYAQTRGQYELFRSQRLTALGQVLDRERTLRAFLGLPVEDGCRLVPADAPTLTPYKPDWCVALNEALSLRPELVEDRQQLKLSQLQIIEIKNRLLPDLRFRSTYNINSIGSSLDGAGNENAFRNLASDHFNDWNLGLVMTVPIGFRAAHAQLRDARLRLAQSYWSLQDDERIIERYLALQYRNLSEFYEQIGILRAQRQAFADQLRARFQEYHAGRGTLDILLEAQRFFATALASEFDFVARYNTALAAFEFAKGTLLQHDNVVIGEGPLPKCAEVRAVEHERERSLALVLRERAKPVCHSPEAHDLPVLPAGEAPSLPALMETAPPPLHGAPETLSPPRQVPAQGDTKGPETPPLGEGVPGLMKFESPAEAPASSASGLSPSNPSPSSLESSLPVQAPAASSSAPVPNLGRPEPLAAPLSPTPAPMTTDWGPGK